LNTKKADVSKESVGILTTDALVEGTANDTNDSETRAVNSEVNSERNDDATEPGTPNEANVLVEDKDEPTLGRKH
jgi:hypothetical protein